LGLGYLFQTELVQFSAFSFCHVVQKNQPAVTESGYNDVVKFERLECKCVP